MAEFLYSSTPDGFTSSSFFDSTTKLGAGKSTDALTGNKWPGSISDVSAEKYYFDKAFEWEPKHQNRFIMEIDGIPAYIIKASSKPSLENGEVVLEHINVQRKVKGKSKWSNITLSLYDPIIPSGAQAVMQWVRDHHESATGRDGYSDDYKKTVTMKGLGAAGQVVEEWSLVGAYIQACNWGSYDWATEDVVTIEMTLAYDYAFLHY